MLEYLLLKVHRTLTLQLVRRPIHISRFHRSNKPSPCSSSFLTCVSIPQVQQTMYMCLYSAGSTNNVQVSLFRMFNKQCACVSIPQVQQTMYMCLYSAGSTNNVHVFLFRRFNNTMYTCLYSAGSTNNVHVFLFRRFNNTVHMCLYSAGSTIQCTCVSIPQVQQYNVSYRQ